MGQFATNVSSVLVLLAMLGSQSAVGKMMGREDADDDKPELDEEDKWTVTKTVYFDFTVDLEPAGRVSIALFGDAAPNTVNNFAALAKGNYRGDVRNTLISFHPTHFHTRLKKSTKNCDIQKKYVSFFTFPQ